MKVQYKRLIVLSCVFFLLVQTAYFWEPWLEFTGMLLVFLLVIVFMTLAGLFIRNRKRLL